MKNQFNIASLPALAVRFSGPSDIPAVLDFYHANQHHNVDNRGDDVLTRRTGEGRTILILKPDRSIGMASMSHPFDQGRKIEIGSTHAPLKDFGLYSFVVASQIIHEFLERPAPECFFAHIHQGNDPVINMLNQKVGWQFMTPTQDFAGAVGEGQTMDTLRWLVAPSDTFPHQARIVENAMEKGYVENKKTRVKMRLDLSGFSLATTYQSHVQELASGRFGEMLEKSQPLPPAEVRKAFENYRQGATYFPMLSSKP